MAQSRCGPCYRDVMRGKNNRACSHKRLFAMNPYYNSRDHMRAKDQENARWFEELKNFHLPNIL